MNFVAVDPGSHQVGYAVFRGDTLIGAGSLKYKGKAGGGARVSRLIDALDEKIGRDYGYLGIEAVACEHTTAMEGFLPAPVLQTFINDLRAWARSHCLEWFIYNPSTVKAAVALRGFGRDKPSIQQAVEALYSVRGLTPDAADAVAIGHCHLIKLREQNLIGEHDGHGNESDQGRNADVADESHAGRIDGSKPRTRRRYAGDKRRRR